MFFILNHYNELYLLANYITMNLDIMKANWDKMTGSLKEQYGKLTGDDIVAAEWKVEKLAATLIEKYELAQEDADKKAEEIMKNIK